MLSTSLYWNTTLAAGNATPTWDTSTVEWNTGGPTGTPVAWDNTGDTGGRYSIASQTLLSRTRQLSLKLPRLHRLIPSLVCNSGNSLTFSSIRIESIIESIIGLKS